MSMPSSSAASSSGSGDGAAAVPGPSPEVLARNLNALMRTSEAAAKRIAATTAREDVTWFATPEGPACALSQWGPLGPGFGEPTLSPLCSRRRPVSEAEAMIRGVDTAACAAVVVLGFGCGFHVAALARKLAKTGVVIVYEPDMGLLRSIFERVDCTAWLDASNVVVIHDSADDALIGQSLVGAEAVLALGTTTLEHVPSRTRLGAGSGEFLTRFTAAMKAIRTTLITTMAQSRATIRNLTQNIDHYVLGPGIAPLAGALSGRAAVVVSAGPSLGRNIGLLEKPGVRDQFCIVAAQTTLKPLLARGIRPHFVTALDFHELSERFYQGLTAEQLRGVTLVVEPKVNPAVTEAFRRAAGPEGVIRCVGDVLLDELLGQEMVRDMGRIESGATVAHLSYYLARYLGCDPVMLIGQDLGFTGGRYYASGAAIHDVWAAELGEFGTLEMHEWQRIVRARGLLRPMTDAQGRGIYSDEQMVTYLMQFQRDFARDASRGLTTIDATEGGVAKQHTVIASLAEAMERNAPGAGAASIDALLQRAVDGARGTARADAVGDVPARRGALRKRLVMLAADARKIAAGSEKVTGLLDEMQRNHADQPRVNKLIGQVYQVRDTVTVLQPAYRLVERLNQTGAFNRYRADRKLRITADSDELRQQQAQIERDVANVQAIADCAEQLGRLLDESVAMLDGSPRICRESLAELAEADAARLERQRKMTGARAAAAASEQPAVELGAGKRVLAVVVARRGGGAISTAAGLEAGFGAGNVLAATVARVRGVAGVQGTVVLSDDAAWARGVLERGGCGAGDERVEVVQARGVLHHVDPAVVRASRAFGADSWRGGVAGLTTFDECFAGSALVELCEAEHADAVLLVDGSWSLVDPTLCAAQVSRYREDPASHRLTFSQAGPGLGGLVIDRVMCEQLRDTRATAGIHATVGGLLSYVPVAPMADPIARSMCVNVPVGVRDLLWRACMDTPARAAAWSGVLAAAGLDVRTVTAEQAAAALAAAASGGPGAEHEAVLRPVRVVADLRGSAGADAFAGVLEAARAGVSAAAVVTVTLRCDERTDAGVLREAAAAAREAGAVVHVRSSLFGGIAEAVMLGEIKPEVISADVHGTSEPVFAAVLASLGIDEVGGRWRASRAGLEQLTAMVLERGTEPGLPLIVPRLAKCDVTLQQVEDFYDNSILRYGWAVIDGPAEVGDVSGGRAAELSALRQPVLALRREALSVRVVGAVGSAGGVGGAACAIEPKVAVTGAAS